MVEFPLVGLLIVVIALAVIQTALIMHTRNVLTDAAVQGALVASLEGNSVEDGREHAERLIHQQLGSHYAASATAEESGDGEIRVEITATFPLVGLLGPAGTFTVDGHATDESVWTGAGAEERS